MFGKDVFPANSINYTFILHGVYWSFALNGAAAEAKGRRWVVWWKAVDHKLCCPVPGCPQAREGQGVWDSFNPQWNFASKHPHDEVAVNVTCLPRCRLCGM